MGISREQALDCLRSTDLIGIGMEADAVRRDLHPEDAVSYEVEQVVSAGPGLMDAIEAAGTDSIGLAITPGMTFAEFTETLLAIKRRFPALCVHSLSDSGMLRLADAARLSIPDTVAGLRDAGLSSFANDGLGTTSDAEKVFELHRCAHGIGISTTMGMIFGAGESLEQRVEHLFAIRAIQEQTGAFTAFTLWSFVPSIGAGIDAPTSVEYMRTLAVSRMVLDNFENIESNCLAQGLKVLQMALRFGANDAGAIHSPGKASFTEEDLRRVIRDAGFKPVERDTLYQTMFLNN